MNKLNCHQCAYKAENPGTTHVRCRFSWATSEVKPPKGDPHGIKRGWWIFPLNYDPVWGSECLAFATEVDKKKLVRVTDPFAEVMAILGSVGR